MSLDRPYWRTVRQLADGTYRSNGNGGYVSDPRYAPGAQHYIRSFLLLQKDLIDLFDYVEPAEGNLRSFSMRIHALLTRACIEVEANLRAILVANGYPAQNNLTMRDYAKIEASHRLSQYMIVVPVWHGNGNERRPFSAWEQEGARIPWYQAYNQAKHDRQDAFANATFEDMLDAVCGCLVLLSAQYHMEDFSGVSYLVTWGSAGNRMDNAIGDFFRIKFPDFGEHERYDFNWKQLRDEDQPFVNYPYPPR